MTCPQCQKDTLRHHTHSEGDRRWVTTRCAECGWVDTTSWVTLKPDVWLQGIEIGTSVSVTYEESKGHRLAVVVRRII
jgi:hypothetical protein